jgi:hypothetical protein
MKLEQDIHLAYCTNVHRGNTWEETFRSLETDVLSVREQVCPDQAYAIGLRLGAEAAAKLRDPEELLAFQKWLEVKNCYVFTINGFPYGEFHGTRVNRSTARTGHPKTASIIPSSSLKSLNTSCNQERKGA